MNGSYFLLSLSSSSLSLKDQEQIVSGGKESFKKKEMGISLEDIHRELASRHVIDHKIKQEKMTK